MRSAEVARHLGLDRSAYSKTEKGLRNCTVDELRAIARLFGMTMDEIVEYDGAEAGGAPKPPAPTPLADASASEQLRLIGQLDEDDRRAVERIVDKMLASKRFREFFEENVAAAR